MTREEIIEELERLKDAIATNRGGELTDYAREHAYMRVASAIDFLEENYNQDLE